MPLAKISGLGEYGVINDVPRFALPPNALSRGINIRAYHGRLKNFGGRQLQTTAPIEPYGLFVFQTPDKETLWLEAGLAQVYVYDGTNHTNLTRASGPYTFDEYASRWTGGIQGTLGFLCPGHEDAPQVWKTINVSTPLEDMTYDPTAAPGSRTWAEINYQAYAMRAFKSTIFALNLQRGSLNLPSTVQWCDFLAPGDTEPDWVPRATNAAGEQPLGETAGNIIDGAELRDDFIVYKEDAAYRCVFTGGDPAFAFVRLPEYVRLINRNCIGVTSEAHVLASRDDVQIFDGNVFRSLLNKRLRELYQSQMFAERLQTTFVSVLNSESEVWICFPTSGTVSDTGDVEKTFPDLAIVWNYADDTLSVTDLPQTRDMDEGLIIPQQADFFDSTVPSDLAFDQDKLRFNQSPFQTNRQHMVGAHGTSLSVFGETPTDDGTARLCLAERMGLVLQDTSSGMLSTDAVWTLRAVVPYIQSTGPVEVQAGAQLAPGAAVQWSPIQSFNPATQREVNMRVTGSYFAYRVRSQADVEWDLTDVEFRYERRRANR